MLSGAHCHKTWEKTQGFERTVFYDNKQYEQVYDICLQ